MHFSSMSDGDWVLMAWLELEVAACCSEAWLWEARLIRLKPVDAGYLGWLGLEACFPVQTGFPWLPRQTSLRAMSPVQCRAV